MSWRKEGRKVRLKQANCDDLDETYLVLVFCYNEINRLMEIKLKREELVKIITGLKMVEELSKGTILEFSRLMKVKEEANDPKSLIEGLQQRIADIFCQEG